MNLTNKKAILFDKDGTLIEYNDLWIEAMDELIHELEKKYKSKKNYNKKILCQQLGIIDSCVTDESPLGTGTTKQIRDTLQHFFIIDKTELLKFVQNYLYQYTIAHQEKLIPIGNLPRLLKGLKKVGYSLGIVTSDGYDSTIFTLKLFEIENYFDVVVTGDRFAPKPEREALEYASLKLGIQPENILYVGDSSVDAKFSKHCGLGIGVTSGVASRDELSKHISFIYETIHDIPYQELHI